MNANKTMCGILCTCGNVEQADIANALKSLEARGPEGTRTIKNGKVILGFTRLSINGINEHGMQPFSNEKMYSITNGEIYNHVDLATRFGIANKSGSDCEILLHLFKNFSKNPVVWAQSLDGVFASVIYDSETETLYLARDPYGVRPMYYGMINETFWVASELKAFPKNSKVQDFPPGCVGVFKNSISIVRYHSVPILKNPYLNTTNYGEILSHGLRTAIQKRMMTERPIAALLSGGLDSSLVAAIVQQELVKRNKPPLETYSIGFVGSPDLMYAQKVAKWIGSNHHEIVCTPQQFFDAIPDVIKDIGSYDITTVRASVGNWLVAKYIKEHSQCKVVFNGDGADEVFGSYIYFYNAPSNEEYEAECSRLLEDIHKFDVLRSDRCISSHGLEPRTPFLDKEFVGIAKSIPTDVRRPIACKRCEKWALRMAVNPSILPEEVLWRRKEAFSDGVSSEKKSWYEEIAERLGTEIVSNYTYLSPKTPEALYYRQIFESYYEGKAEIIPYFWMPKWTNAIDPSARTILAFLK